METKEQSVTDAIDNDYKYGFVPMLNLIHLPKALTKELSELFLRKRASPSSCLILGSRPMRNG